ncbi:alpha/beta hydrolase [Umezawaea beigongshangensis]|uniref:alpha/beta hydrolase n=1 Tax=Umezawaea beigongshangensis TaxID=2780383 RepID=UPI0018F19C9B|nr:alpha/beta hydrolase [Umezawaea beigongshangensis]
MIDPEILHGKLAAGDAGRVAAAADPITGAISAVERAGASIGTGASTATSSWTGEAATRFGTRAELSATAATAAAQRLAAGVDVVQAASRAYSTMRASADRAVEVWRSRPPGLDEARTRELAERVNTALEKVRTGYEGALRSYAGALATIKPGFQEVAGGDAAWTRAVQRAGAVTVPGANTDPKQVAAWWKSLAPEQQQELLRTRFQELGQLRGLPSGVLDQANRARIADDAQRFAGERDRLDARLRERAAELGLDPADGDDLTALLNDPEYARLHEDRQVAATKADNALAVQKSVDEAERLAIEQGWLRPDGSPDVRILAWDPYGPRGDGATAIAYGDPDTARNLAVCVPGTGSTLDSFSVSQAGNLREAMGPEGSATVQWLGYDAPGWAIGEVDDPAQAREGGANLVADVDGYRAAATGDQHVTVIGHSYGSTTVGHAGMNGLAADDIAFVGSPGVGASNVDQLSAGPGHVYAGATEHDPVVQGTSQSWFTEDGSSTGPYDRSFGATVFGTPDSKGVVDAHSQYYDRGSESVENLAKIANGDGHAVSTPNWADSPVPTELPGSHLPVVGPVLDWGANTAKEVYDAGGDVVTGAGRVADSVGRGDWGGAAGHAWDTTKEVGSDALDVVVDTAGNTAELGRDVVEGGKDLWDTTVGSWF